MIEVALRKAGIEELNELQKEAYRVIKEGKNLLIVAPTGSGKTEAALIPILEEIYDKNYEGIALIYVTPLRALNRDLLRRISVICEELGLTVAVRHGDTSKSERERQSKKPPQILITTPETFQILFLGRYLRKALSNVKFVVVDEVHELAESERGVQLTVALERLREYSKFQLIALSATVGDVEKVKKFLKCDGALVSSLKKEYVFRIVKPEVKEEDRELARELLVEEIFAAELRCMKEIIEKYGSALIFVNTRQTAEFLASKLKKLIPIEVHHGSLSKEVRIENERRFLRREVKALVCTSSMELGIDIGHVNVVIQYNSPREVVRLIQRAGRSGHRIDRISVCYIISSSFDEILESAAIVSGAISGELEEVRIHENSLDVLANQIAGIVLEKRSIDPKFIYSLIKRSYPFRNLSEEEFYEVLNFLDSINVVRFDGDLVRSTKKTRVYFYENISMIPDEKHYPVRDVVSGKVIGVLDEKFLQTFSGELFTMKGDVWRVLSVDDEVKVAPATSEASVPSWVGEEIPVPFEVADRVGIIRKLALARGERYLVEKFNMNEEAAKLVLEVLRKHAEKFAVPGGSEVVVEGEKEVVVNACLGHRVNEVLGRVLALLLSARSGRNVSIEFDPYRIKLYPASSEDLIRILEELSVLSFEQFRELVVRAISETKLFQWKFVNVARKMGYLSKEVETSRINVQNLVRKLANTPVFKEAVREMFTERLDVKRAHDFVRNINRYEIHIYSERTPIGEANQGLSFDIISGNREEAILDHFIRRLEDEDVVIYCVNCSMKMRKKLALLNEKVCPRCKGSMIAVFSGRRDPNEFKKEELYRMAELYRVHGKRAAYALCTYGIGVDTAARVLSGFYPDEREFFKKLLETEKNYIRTRKFWDL